MARPSITCITNRLGLLATKHAASEACEPGSRSANRSGIEKCHCVLAY